MSHFSSNLEEHDIILQPQTLNGRVNIIDIPAELQFSMQEKIAVENKSTEYRDALTGLIEENILSNNIGFLINCNLNFNDGDLNQLFFESYPLI